MVVFGFSPTDSGQRGLGRGALDTVCWLYMLWAAVALAAVARKRSVPKYFWPIFVADIITAILILALHWGIWRKIAFTPTMPVFPVVGEIAWFRQLFVLGIFFGFGRCFVRMWAAKRFDPKGRRALFVSPSGGIGIRRTLAARHPN
jgi:hypothetical protein